MIRIDTVGVLGVSVKEFVEMIEEGFELDLPELSDYQINLIIFRLTQILSDRGEKKIQI